MPLVYGPKFKWPKNQPKSNQDYNRKKSISLKLFLDHVNLFKIHSNAFFICSLVILDILIQGLLLPLRVKSILRVVGGMIILVPIKGKVKG